MGVAQRRKEMTTSQHFIPEWNTESGVAMVIARIYVDNRRTSAYVEIPPGPALGNVPEGVWAKAQAMYREDDDRVF